MKKIEEFVQALLAAGYAKAESKLERIKTLQIVKGEPRAETTVGHRINVIASPAALLDEETKNFKGLAILEQCGLKAANIQSFGGELVFIGVSVKPAGEKAPEKK